MEPPISLSLTPLAQVAAGLLLLLLGRRLFWLFVGIIGFFAGVQFGAVVAAGQSEAVLLLIALAIGLVGALLAIVLQRVAVAIAGGIAGGMLAMKLSTYLGFSGEPAAWFAFVIGAVLAAIVISLLFDWALIVLSALTGAVFVAGAIPVNGLLGFCIMVALFVTGCLVQSRVLREPAPA
jgi:MFS family permease